MGILIPILALCIPLVALLAKSDIGHAIADAIRHNSGANESLGGGEQLQQMAAELEMLRGDVDQARSELSEVHERLDFAERLLARGQEHSTEGKP